MHVFTIMQTKAPSKLSSMFSGTQDKCAFCKKTAYPLEKVSNPSISLSLSLSLSHTHTHTHTQFLFPHSLAFIPRPSYIYLRNLNGNAKDRVTLIDIYIVP